MHAFMNHESLKEEISRLVSNVARLRSPEGGCPWFRQQTFLTLRRHLLEEVCEVLEPLEAESPDGLQEELGDLLFQVVMLSQMASERGWFSLAEVLHRLNAKVMHRNPHVFGEVQAETVDEVQRIWLERKSLEKDGPRSPWEGFPLKCRGRPRRRLVSKEVVYPKPVGAFHLPRRCMIWRPAWFPARMDWKPDCVKCCACWWIWFVVTKWWRRQSGSRSMPDFDGRSVN